ncbi:hypothetical protein HNY73_001561 [Argiope bruennichi]|uniref:Peptidase aspartic putative domain-containing protein n=1 Tax=Argiope bruennichi TaxID=94029 RepID=A0A8T0G2W3_ARGBR|nr:hypothetical protein HNY73_001561 [Argiope bruennichi]
MFPPHCERRKEGEKRKGPYESNQCYSEVFLQTLLDRLSFQGKEKTVRALVDTGSQKSCILDSAIQEMGFKSFSTEMLTQVVFGGVTARKSYNVCLNSLHKDYSIRIQALNQPVICGSIPGLNNKICFERAKKMGIQLKDVRFGEPLIEILIGSDFAGKIYTGVINELVDELFSVQTWLVWMIMRKTPEEPEQESYGSSLTSL